jgi:hypothetical protein
MLYRFRHKIVGPLVIAWLLLTVASVFSRLMVWNQLAGSLRSTEEATLLGNDLNALYDMEERLAVFPALIQTIRGQTQLSCG